MQSGTIPHTTSPGRRRAPGPVRHPQGSGRRAWPQAGPSPLLFAPFLSQRGPGPGDGVRPGPFSRGIDFFWPGSTDRPHG